MGTELEYPPHAPSPAEMMAFGGTALQTKTSHATAIRVQVPRQMKEIQRRLRDAAALAGERMYYGWGAGKDRIEGPSIKLAMACVSAYGNCAVEMGEVQDIGDSWIINAVFVDLETGATITRPFRQSKRSVVAGKHDEERKMDIRFQIGVSKATRNVVVNAMPVGLIDMAIDEAKAAVKSKIESYIQKNGKVAAVVWLTKELSKYGIKEEQILDKFSVATLEGLSIDQLVLIRGDLSALMDGQESATTLYPIPEAKPVASLNDLAGKAVVPQTVEPMKEATAEESSDVRTDQESRTVDAPGTNPERTALYTEVFPTLGSKKEVQELADKAKADAKLFPADRTVVDRAAQKRLLEITGGRGSRSKGGDEQ